VCGCELHTCQSWNEMQPTAAAHPITLCGGKGSSGCSALLHFRSRGSLPACAEAGRAAGCLAPAIVCGPRAAGCCCTGGEHECLTAWFGSSCPAVRTPCDNACIEQNRAITTPAHLAQQEQGSASQLGPFAGRSAVVGAHGQAGWRAACSARVWGQC